MSDIRLMKPGHNGQLINEYGISETPPSDWAFLKAGEKVGLKRLGNTITYLF